MANQIDISTLLSIFFSAVAGGVATYAAIRADLAALKARVDIHHEILFKKGNQNETL